MSCFGSRAKGGQGILSLVSTLGLWQPEMQHVEIPKQGTGGFLLVFFHGPAHERVGFVSEIPDTMYQIWSPGDAKIAQLELLQVLIALVTVPERFRGRRGVWYIDNTAALMSLTKGRSASKDLERMSSLIHLLLLSLKCWIYWEWAPSKSNWADAISREGSLDEWHRSHGFSCALAHFPVLLWFLPLRAVVRLGELL